MSDIFGTTGDDNLIGTPQDDRIFGLAGNDFLFGAGGSDQLEGDEGNDTYRITDANALVIEAAGEGHDVVYTSVNYTLTAGQHIEVFGAYDPASTSGLTLIGNALAQIIGGTAGADLVIGGGGADILAGRGGDDTYIVGDANELVYELAGEGNDVVYTTVSYALSAGYHVELLLANDPASLAALTLTGNEFAQGLAGNAGANVLNGGGGADTLVGRGGDDTLNGGTGLDHLIGGTGNDAYLVDNVSEIITENDGEGHDVVYTSVNYSLSAALSIEVLVAADAASTLGLTLIGNGFSQNIGGTAGADTLIGGGGADILGGRTGDDIYIVTDANALIYEVAGEGRDVVYTTVNYAISAGYHVEVLMANDPASTLGLTLIGNELDQIIGGTAGADTLIGGGGVDILGGRGGNDTYIVNAGTTQVLEASGEGTDVVYTTVSLTLELGQHVEALLANDPASFVGLTLIGNELGQTISGTAGDDLLIGRGGADNLGGRGGNDIYRINDAAASVNELNGEGNDSVYASVSYVLNGLAHVELLATEDAASTAAINLTGNELGQRIEGNAGANVLSGQSGDDVMVGAGGDDTLDGGDGDDVLTGGAGADMFRFTSTIVASDIDSITDYTVGLDRIELNGAGPGQTFANLATGTLRAGTLVIGTAAVDADDYFIYNSATGALLFDQDGVGAAAATQFATLAPGLALTVADFLVSGSGNAAPSISSGTTASIAENSPASVVVYQTAAADPNGDRITYSLSGADAHLLSIDAGGAVRLLAPADFETKSLYQFNVVASDSNASTVKGIQLTITDVPGDASTPTINETSGNNDVREAAQVIDRNVLAVAPNQNLHDDDLPSATILGGISANGDKDFFSIVLQAGERLILDVDGTTGGLDSHLRLYNAAGTEIGDNDDRIDFDPGSVSTIAPHNTDSQILFRAATSGTYFFSIEGFENTSSGGYQLHVSIGPPATAQQLQAEDIEGLISGAEWNHTDLTFGFPTSAGQYPGSPGEATPASEFQAFNAAQRAATIQLLQMIANVSPLTFTQDTVTPGQADLRYGMSTDSEVEVAHAYYPTNGGPSSQGGQAWFNDDDFLDPQKGDYAWMGILHETGHALGLKHGHEFPIAISADRDSVEYTVMTYRSFPGASINGYQNEDFGYPQTLMMYDIAALQQIYGGANYGFNAGNSVYTWSDTTGEMSINGAGQGAPGNGIGGIANRIFLTIWDGGGTDTYNLSNYVGPCSIDLRPGEWTRTGANQLANLDDNAGGPHFARGNIANALIFQGNTASLIENAIGGGGGDTIIANQVANQLTGNGGGDFFKWAASGDAGTGALADTITDFVRGSDRIDLSSVDAIPATGAIDDFAFIGTSAFSNVAGQLRYQVEGANLRVQADLDGNGVADMEIVVNNNTMLAASDFNF